MEELGLPELTSEQIEELCALAEESARRHVLSKVASKRIEALNISVEANGTRPVTLTVEIDITLSPLLRDFNIQKLADEAVKKAFKAAEKYLEELKCHLKK